MSFLLSAKMLIGLQEKENGLAKGNKMAFSVSYIFQALDEFSAPARQIIASTAKISKSISNLSNKVKEASEKIKKFGEGMSLYLSLPAVAFGVESIRDWDRGEKAIAQVEAALKSTGGAAGLTSKQLQAAAESLQSHSLFTHTDVLGQVTAQMLRFHHVTGSTFIRAQKAAADLSARTGMSLSGSAVMIGRALEDPARGMMRLARAGVILSDTQKRVIFTLAHQGKLIQAQKVILDAFSNSLGGSAEAAAKAGAGPLQQLANDFEDLRESIGGVIAEAILPYTGKIKALIDRLKALDPATKKIIVVAIGLIAVIGPLVIAIGILGVALSGLGTIIAIIFSPITLGIIILGALVVGCYELYEHFDQIKKSMPSFGEIVIGIFKWIGTEIDYVIKKVEEFKNIITSIPKFGGLLIQKTVDFVSNIDKQQPNPLLSNIPQFNSANRMLSPNGINGSLDVNINVNDPNQTIKTVETKSDTVSHKVNVGKTMGHI